ncbi:F-box protein SKIP23-like [Pistacia vera]|uniref:F-box protein SKIP23-like n=1 Tax=Pistacia vera TaxID=55513 RepID=UPI001263BDE3|nr:F-box protein SKIP23-like [Pistacia vera]
MDTNTPDWSSLPDHLLASIEERLPTRIDRLCFRAVCNSFRSSIPPPLKPASPHADLKITLPGLPPLVLVEFTFYAIKSLPSISNPNQIKYTWLVKSEELHNGKVRLEDPFSSRRLGIWDDWVPESEKLPESLNLLDYRVKEVAKAYRLEVFYQGKDINSRIPCVFGKAVVSSGHDASDDGFAVMTITRGNVLMWRNVDKKWAIINVGYEDPLDVIYHNETFFALMSTGVTVTVDSKSVSVSQVAGPLQIEGLRIRSDLIKSFQDLFLIIKISIQSFEFMVYKLDEGKREWVAVMDGLEDSVFFVGYDGSFTLSA